MTVDKLSSYLKVANHSNGCGVVGDEVDDEPEAISTGLPLLNSAFFPLFNGIPRCGLTEIVGLPGSGKTSFA